MTSAPSHIVHEAECSMNPKVEMIRLREVIARVRRYANPRVRNYKLAVERIRTALPPVMTKQECERT